MRRPDAPAATGYRSLYRTENERFDAMVADTELRSAGIVEDDEPTEYSHDAWMRSYYERMRGFTPAEREQIRVALGLGTFGDAARG